MLEEYNMYANTMSKNFSCTNKCIRNLHILGIQVSVEFCPTFTAFSDTKMHITLLAHEHCFVARPWLVIFFGCIVFLIAYLHR